MADSSSTASGQISGVAERYASALFELAVSEKKIPAVEKDLNRFGELLKGSDDLMRLVKSPVFSADDQVAALDAILAKAKITELEQALLKKDLAFGEQKKMMQKVYTYMNFDRNAIKKWWKYASFLTYECSYHHNYLVHCFLLC